MSTADRLEGIADRLEGMVDGRAAVPEPVFVDIPGMQQRLKLGRSKLLAEIAAGRIEVVHVGRRVLATPDALRRYAVQLEVEAAQRRPPSIS